MMFDAYLKKGLLKKQRPNFDQIGKQLVRAKKDLKVAQSILDLDPEWAATISYQSMLRAGRAYLFSKGVLPADGAQHKTVVELVGQMLGKNHSLLIEKFERMRKKRNLFFYESDPGTMTEAENALKAAMNFISLIEEVLREENPQISLQF